MKTELESVVASWPGVETLPHRFGGGEFSLDGREFGHVHGDRQVDIPFSKRVRDAVVSEGLASEHHLFPESGWVTKYLDAAGDVAEAVRLLRIAYLYRVAALQRRDAVDDAVARVDVAAELDGMALPAGVRDAFPPLAGDSRTAVERVARRRGSGAARPAAWLHN